MAKKLAFDKFLFAVIAVLVALGLGLVYTASGAVAAARDGDPTLFLRKQALAALLGFTVMVALMHIDYRLLRSRPVIWALVGLAITALVATLFSSPINGSRRWLQLGSLSFQASEVAKFVMVLYLAYQIEDKGEPEREPQLLLAALVVPGLMAGLVQLEPDLGTAVTLTGIAMLMLFLGGLRWRWLIGTVAAGAVAVAILIVVEPYRLDRMEVFLDPGGAPLAEGYQPRQSLIAVGSGGLVGRGPGESRQRELFLPQAHSDFVFAILAEEHGLLGALAVVALFAVLVWRGMRAGIRAPDTFGRYAAFGFTGALAVQALLNVSVALTILPTTGITLPLLSYGGSSLIMTLAGCGVVLNVSQHA